MRIAIASGLFIFSAMSNAQHPGESTRDCPSSGARVYVSATGAVSLNGKRVAVTNLQRALEQLDPRPSVICYARDNPEREPHPDALAALEAVMSLRMPIALFRDATFKGAGQK